MTRESRITRRICLTTAVRGGAAVALGAGVLARGVAPAHAQQAEDAQSGPGKTSGSDPAAKKRRDKGPQLPREMVEEFVGVSHSSLDRVKALLVAQPALANAAWDWGGGDWETGLGAAAHMGRPDIAGALLAADARLDVFAAAMLGRLEIVRAVLEAFPEALHVPGPHGIPLIRHAEVGGEAAKPVLAYLRERVAAAAASGSSATEP